MSDWFPTECFMESTPVRQFCCVHLLTNGPTTNHHNHKFRNYWLPFKIRHNCKTLPCHSSGKQREHRPGDEGLIGWNNTPQTGRNAEPGPRKTCFWGSASSLQGCSKFSVFGKTRTEILSCCCVMCIRYGVAVSARKFLAFEVLCSVPWKCSLFQLSKCQC